MLIFKRFLPYVRPYSARLMLAGLLVSGVALINLALVRLAGTLWDIVTVQHDADRMTRSIGLFLGWAIAT
jgi:ATP-binding cassette, subfamily B, bacterial MsbA